MSRFEKYAIFFSAGVLVFMAALIVPECTAKQREKRHAEIMRRPSLTYCRACERQISSQAIVCPGCGHPR